MQQIDLTHRRLLYPLFSDMHDTLIYSCLQGYMGSAYADSLSNPQIAAVRLGDFVFLAASPDATQSAIEELLAGLNQLIASDCEAFLLVPGSVWLASIISEFYGPACTALTRYAIPKRDKPFDTELLLQYKNSLPSGYRLNKIDIRLAERCCLEEWSKDFVSNFTSAEDFVRRGAGYVILNGTQIISGASSYSIFNNGIEIQISTHNEYRRQGLALACGSALILDCQEHNIYPNWDAANPGSVALSQRLGYPPAHEYLTCEINCACAARRIKPCIRDSFHQD